MRLNDHISKFLPLYIALGAVIAYMVPGPFAVFEGSTDFLLGFVIFLAGLSMALEDLAILKKSFFIISTGLFLKWTLTVALSVVLAVVFFSNLPEIADGLILTGSVPSGTAATLYTFLAGGNASLIVAMGILDVFISPVLTPAIMDFFASGSVVVSFFQLAKKMFFIVILPIVLGMTARHLFQNAIHKITEYRRFASSFTIVFIVVTVVASVSSQMKLGAGLLVGLTIAVFVQVLLPMLAGYKIALLAGIKRESAIAILFEVGLCNSALAAILALEFFGVTAAIPAVINMIINLSLGAYFSNYLGRESELLLKREESS